MRSLLIGGGVLDFATLHPVDTVLGGVVAVVVVLWAARSLAARRARRLRRSAPEPDGHGRPSTAI